MSQSGDDNALVDIGVNLVEAYLRLAGYLTLSEFEVQGLRGDGSYETITDVDIVAVRFPGDVFVGDPDDSGGLLLIDDPALLLEDDCVDVIVGEVKQGEATINPGLTDHRTLHAVLQRIDWVYDGGDIDHVIEELGDSTVCTSNARGGGTVRTRIVAFGQAPETTVNIISHTHIVNALLGFFERFDDAFRPIQFKEPAIGFLRLLAKSGFEVERPD